VLSPYAILPTLLAAQSPAFSADELLSGAIRVTSGLAVASLVYLLARRLPWPRPFRLRFVAAHVVAAPLFAAAWLLLSSAGTALVFEMPTLVHDRWPFVGGVWVPDRGGETIFVGTFLYLVVAGLSYAAENSARAARAEALAARTQLAALRAQVHPHFLFNALHTVVQLIPIEPRRAAEAAELVGELLRATLEEQRDEVTLGDEWEFVSRYLALERIRFGDRLAVRAELDEGLLDEHVPAFALQTLVENAVQHGAAPRVAPTEIVVTAAGSASELTLVVRNTGDAGPARAAKSGPGTGLARLRERLAALHGRAARLACRPTDDGGFEAVLVVPRHRGSAA
jgi:two-component system LytT family sensor kinase